MLFVQFIGTAFLWPFVRWAFCPYTLANTSKHNVNNQNFNVWNSHRQHAARLFQTTQYERLSQQ